MILAAKAASAKRFPHSCGGRTAAARLPYSRLFVVPRPSIRPSVHPAPETTITVLASSPLCPLLDNCAACDAATPPHLLRGCSSSLSQPIAVPTRTVTTARGGPEFGEGRSLRLSTFWRGTDELPTTRLPACLPACVFGRSTARHIIRRPGVTTRRARATAASWRCWTDGRDGGGGVTVALLAANSLSPPSFPSSLPLPLPAPCVQFHVEARVKWQRAGGSTNLNGAYFQLEKIAQ